MNPLSSSGPAGRLGVPPRLVSGSILSLLLLTPALLLAALPAWAERLAFDRAAIAAGEWWRLLTCQWTHWTPDHLFWDLLAFAILIPLCWIARPGRTLGTLALCLPLIPLAVWFGIPEMTAYRGLSGIDSALFVFLASHGLRRVLRDRDRGAVWLHALPLALFSLKIGCELYTGEALFARGEGFVPVPLAHLVGAACGAVAAWLRLPRRFGRSNSPGSAVDRGGLGWPVRRSGAGSAAAAEERTARVRPTAEVYRSLPIRSGGSARG